MAALVCEICGGKLQGKAGGIFVCESCGMEYDKSWAQEKIQEIKGTVRVEGTVNVRVDNTDYHKNYLDMAISAFGSGNNAECEKYCNMVLESDPNNITAHLYKGKAAGWQSTLGNIKIQEMLFSFTKALDLALDDEREELIDDCVEEIVEVSSGLIQIQLETFSKYPDEEEAKNVFTLVNIASKAIMAFNEQYMDDYGENMLVALNPTLVKICEVSISTASRVFHQYLGEIQTCLRYKNFNGAPNQFDAQKACQELLVCTNVVIKCSALVLAEYEITPDKSYLTEDRLLAVFKEATGIYDIIKGLFYIEYNYITDSYDQKKLPTEYHDLAKQLKNDIDGKSKKLKTKIDLRKKKEAEEKEKVRQKEESERRKVEEERRREQAFKEKQQEEAKKARIAAYWAEHPEEKQGIQSQINEQRQKINALHAQKKALKNSGTIVTFEETIKKLQNEMDSLGVFKAKKKQELSQQIEKLQREKANEEARIFGEIDELDAEISARRKRVSALMEELEKDR